MLAGGARPPTPFTTKTRRPDLRDIIAKITPYSHQPHHHPNDFSDNNRWYSEKLADATSDLNYDPDNTDKNSRRYSKTPVDAYSNPGRYTTYAGYNCCDSNTRSPTKRRGKPHHSYALHDQTTYSGKQFDIKRKRRYWHQHFTKDTQHCFFSAFQGNRQNYQCLHKCKH